MSRNIGWLRLTGGGQGQGCKRRVSAHRIAQKNGFVGVQDGGVGFAATVPRREGGIMVVSLFWRACLWKYRVVWNKMAAPMLVATGDVAGLHPCRVSRQLLPQGHGIRSPACGVPAARHVAAWRVASGQRTLGGLGFRRACRALQHGGCRCFPRVGKTWGEK